MGALMSMFGGGGSTPSLSVSPTETATSGVKASNANTFDDSGSFTIASPNAINGSITLYLVLAAIGLIFFAILRK